MGDDYAAGWNMEDVSYLMEDGDARTIKEHVRDYCVNDGPKLVFIILYILGNLALFLGKKKNALLGLNIAISTVGCVIAFSFSHLSFARWIFEIRFGRPQ